MTSFIYKNPRLYDTFIRLLYLDGLKILNTIIGPERSVFEPACGYGRMNNYLDTSCTYAGIDLNERFVAYGQRKARNIRYGNALDHRLYQNSDVVLLADILHHLSLPDIRQLMRIARRFAREKIVIIEPVFVHIGSKNNFFSRLISKLMIYCDSDGYNDIRRWMSKEEYHNLFHLLKDSNDIREMKITHHRNHDFVEMFV